MYNTIECTEEDALEDGQDRLKVQSGPCQVCTLYYILLLYIISQFHIEEILVFHKFHLYKQTTPEVIKAKVLIMYSLN